MLRVRAAESQDVAYCLAYSVAELKVRGTGKSQDVT